jgi:hypothetical protein
MKEGSVRRDKACEGGRTSVCRYVNIFISVSV